MGRTNYSKMSTQKIKEQDKVFDKEPVPVEPEVDEECTACAINLDDVSVEPEVVVPVNSGKVINCDRLNVREKTNAKSKVLEVIERGAPVDVFTTESTNDWYKVTTRKGVVGYCMKEYITLN